MSHLLVGSHNVIECVRDFSLDADPRTRESHREITVPHRLQRHQNHAQIGGRGSIARLASPVALSGRLEIFG
jgi:hypothetical protein